MTYIKNTVVLLLLSFVLFGCAGTVKHMQVVPPGKVVDKPKNGNAVVVFMRPSTLGFAVQSSVFNVTGKKSELVGVVAAKKKVAYQVKPGKHVFMAIGESADFMYAELEKNKTYYALVTPRMGLWKARFSLKPVHANELNTDEFKEWVNSCEWVETNESSYAWANSNMESIKEKRAEYYQDWMEKAPADRPKLRASDGS